MWTLYQKFTVLGATICSLALNSTLNNFTIPGYKQASVVILHKSLADDFEKFCHANSGALPLLYRSKPGEWKCPSLSSDSDTR